MSDIHSLSLKEETKWKLRSLPVFINILTLIQAYTDLREKQKNQCDQWRSQYTLIWGLDPPPPKFCRSSIHSGAKPRKRGGKKKIFSKIYQKSINFIHHFT